MSLASKGERALVTHDEFQLVAQTHHPALGELSPEALAQTRQRLRDLRSREQTFVRGLRRTIKGRADERGGSHPGNVDKPSRRKRVFSGALKRINAEMARRQAIAAREELQRTARKALHLKKAVRRHHPEAGRSSHAGMKAIDSDRTRSTIAPARIGSVSQATKVAQAVRDN